MPRTANKFLTVRCTPRELYLWKQLAKHKNKSVSSMIRDGLDKIISSTCICEPGSLPCPYCSSKLTPIQTQYTKKVTTIPEQPFYDDP